jgi:hypothetical protein
MMFIKEAVIAKPRMELVLMPEYVQLRLELMKPRL